MKKAQVVFEEITVIHYPLIAYFLWRGYKISVFDFKYNLKKHRWMRKLINEQKVTRIYVTVSSRENGEAIDATEEIYEHFKENKLAQISASLYRNDAVKINFKKALVNEVFRCIYINWYLNKIQNKAGPREDLRFFPTKYKKYADLIGQHRGYCLKNIEQFKTAPWYAAFLPVTHRCEQIKFYCASIVYILFKAFFLYAGQLSKKEIRQRHFENAVALDMFDLHGIFTSNRSSNFLLNGGHINKENTMFIVNCPLSDKWSAFYEKNGYNFIETKKIGHFLELARVKYNTDFVKEAMRAIWKMLGQWNAPAPLLYAFFVNVRTFFNWKLLLQQVSFKNYIYSNQESAQQSARNILIRNQKGRTWNYAFCLGGGYLYADHRNNLKEHRSIYWSFLDFDYYVGVNDIAVEFYKLHNQRVKEYFTIGSIYSEMIKEKLSSDSKEEFSRKCFGKDFNADHKVISFFDTTFIDSQDCITTFEDCLEFYQDIFRLVSSKKNISIIIKPSKFVSWFIEPSLQYSSPEKGEKIARLWEKLQSHPRVFWAFGNSKEGAQIDFTNNNDVIAASDLVVTHLMSSPTAEALGARKKAIWYKSRNTGRRSLYDSVPGLIIYGYEALEKRIDALLGEVSDAEYDAYLDSYIKGTVVSSLDGLAITNFRELLRNHGCKN